MAINFKTGDLKRKRPFTKITPLHKLSPLITDDPHSAEYIDEKPSYHIVTQADFMRELDPNGHLIYDHEFYPDKLKFVDKEVTDALGNKTTQTVVTKQRMVRVAFALQLMIKTQQLIHLCGNDLHHELNSSDGEGADASRLFNLFKQGWYNKQVDTVFFRFCDNIKSTGDGAVSMYIDESGKLVVRAHGFLNGETLYYHTDPLTGKPASFMRTFDDYDSDGSTVTRYAEVFDNEYRYILRQDLTGVHGVLSKAKEWLGLDGYSVIMKRQHGYTELPVAYFRDPNGACWSPVQDSCDIYELGFSHLCQNNLAFAFPILVMKGDDIQIQGDEITGAVKGFVVGADANVDYLKAPESPESFKLELDTLLKNIFRGSNTVEPPEIKSGDTPGVSVKLIFFPAIQKAMKDAADLSDSIQKISRLFKYGYSIESGTMTQMAGLDILTWAVPYIPQNDQERINNLVQEVGSGIKSHKTACEQTGDGAFNEYELIAQEQKEAQQSDVLSQLLQQQQKAVSDANDSASTAIKQQQNDSDKTPDTKI